MKYFIRSRLIHVARARRLLPSVHFLLGQKGLFYPAAILCCLLSFSAPTWSKGPIGGSPGGGPSVQSDGRFDEKIDPFSADSDQLGLTASAPFVSVNEFTGKVSVRLPAIGAPGLRLTPSYVAPNRQPVPGHDTFPYRPEYERSVLGIGWHLHPGLLVARQGNAHRNPQEGQGVWERVGHLDSGGNFTAFYRDGIFQSIPNGLTASGAGWGDTCPPEFEQCLPRVDPHFIDDAMRRITREVVSNGQAPAFAGSGGYFLLEPNGRRTRFEPTATVATEDARSYVYFYPVEITAPNGRSRTIHYTAPLMNNPRPLIDSIEDSFGRHLDFEYQTLAGRSYVRELWLRDSQTAARTLLARFSFVTLDGDVHLRSITTPEGHRTVIDMESETVAGQLYPFVNKLTIPQGGEVEIDYSALTIEKELPILEFGCYDKYNCLEPQVHTISETWLRVSRLAHSGGVYRFTYTQDAQAALQAPQDWRPYHGQWTWSEDPVSPLTVLVEQVEVPAGEKTYSRATTFFGVPTTGTYQSMRLSGNSHLIGYPAMRQEQYCQRSSAAVSCPEKKDEVWIYSDKSRVNGKTPHLVTGGTSEAGPSFLPVIKQHAVRRDDVWMETEFFYNYFGDDVQWGEQIHTDLTLPSEIRRRAYGSSKSLHQRFDYLHRFHLPPVTDQVEAADHPFVLGLRESSEQTAFTDVAGVDIVQKRIETDFLADLPLPRTRRLFSDHQSDPLSIEFTYYDSGPHAGLLKTRTLGGPQFGDRILDYQFGVASRVEPIGGTALAPATVRQVSFDGTLASETSTGVTRTFSFDDDRRLIRTNYPLDASTTIDYSPPITGPPATVDSCLDNWVERRQGDRRSRSCSDAWGRAGRTEYDIDSGVTGVMRADFDAIGLRTRTENALGGVSVTEADVWGRPIEVEITDGENGAPVRYQRFDYSTDAATGNQRVRELHKLSEHGSEEIVRFTEIDLAGRFVAAGYGDTGARTRFEYRAESPTGLQEVTVMPDGGPSRKSWGDWLGRTVKEEHPEIGTTYYQYDHRGLLVGRYNSHGGVESERYRYTYDALGRVVKEEAFADGEYRTTREFSFHAHNGQLAEARVSTDEPSRTVRSTISRSDYDAQQRPVRAVYSIPTPFSPVDGLRPGGRFDAGPLQPLRWFGHEAATRYVVELRRRDLDSLRFGTTETELVLTSPGFAEAVNDQLTGASRTAYQQDMAANPFGFLDPAQRYQWRVRAFSRQHEPTQWSRWVNLSNGCRVEEFVVEDGVDTGPLIQWRTADCGDGEHTVRVRVSTLPGTTEPGCALDDGLFSAHPTNNQTAHFMAIGYNYEDVLAAHDPDPDYVPELFGPKDCAPLQAADFRLDIEHHPTGDIVDSREALRARVLSGSGGCRIFNFYVNDGYGGEAPEVTWQTRNCQGRHVEIRRSTVDPSIDGACELFEDPWSVGPNGQMQASFMTSGWIGRDGRSCDPVTEAAFSIEVRSSPSEGATVLASRPAALGAIDPDHGEDCHVRYLGTEISSPTHLPTELLWQTEGCGGKSVRVKASSADGSVPAACLLRQKIFSTRQQGPQEALFMAEGYVGHEGTVCGVVPEAELWVELWDEDFQGEGFGTPGGLGSLGDSGDSGGPGGGGGGPGGGGGGPSSGQKASSGPQKALGGSRLLYRSLPVRLEYTGPLTGPSQNCQILSFDIENRTGDLPIVSWQTDCSDPGPISVQVKTSTVGVLDPGCRLDGALWDGHKNGSRTVDYMVGGYSTPQDPGASCPGVANAEFWIELRDENDGSALIDRSETLAATYSPVSPLCRILDFAVTDDTDGPPRVSWQTDCPDDGSVSVQVRATTGPSTPPQCAVTNAIWDGAKNGSRSADFMVGGYGPGCECPAVESAWFQVKLVDTSDGNRLVQQSSFEEGTYQEPADLPCRILSCSAVSGSAPGVLPVISWQTTCPDPGAVSVQVKTTTSWSVPPSCRLNGALWDGHKNGSRTADYMAGGYSPDDQPSVQCPAVPGSWFWVELRWGNRLIKRSDFMWTSYEEPEGPCSVESFRVENSSSAGVLPRVVWNTSCSASHGVDVVVKTSTVGQVPPECVRDADPWAQSFDGSELVHYMAGEGACGPIENSQFWIEIRDSSDPSLLYERSSYVDAAYSPLN